MRNLLFLTALLGALNLTGQAHAGDTPANALTLKKGDHVTLIGNTLPDRMQHDGWLETLIQNRFPEHELVFRNLAFPGDELDVRPRSENFGSPEVWLTKTKTDVVFAFFGYNEAFAGEEGLPAFREKLRHFIDTTRAADYSGKGSPRLVLFSPIAHEDLNDPSLPDGREHNVVLEQYATVMKEVAQEKQVPFVDLFHPSYGFYAREVEPVTMNGVHLTSDGNRMISEVIVDSLFGKKDGVELEALEPLRQAILDKNFRWFNNYRAIDGYNIFGGRSALSWFGQSNADVMQREMEIFTVQAENRDHHIWALANGRDFVVDDSNTPPTLVVKSNIQGPNEDGTFPFLGGEEAIGVMTLGEGLQANLFASEEQFPELANPVQMAVDPDGRLFVATWPTYPHWHPNEPLSDKIVILDDDNQDGKADRLTVFADNLNSVTGFEFWGGGVLVAAAPEIIFLKDTDGDDVADLKIRMLQGISSEDSHHTANSLLIGPDGGLYFSRGLFHVDNMETPTKTFRATQDGTFRFDPRTYEVEFVHPIGPNPHGLAVDQWGYLFANDGTTGRGNYVSIGKGVAPFKNWFPPRVRPVPATGILDSSQFPDEFKGNFLVCNAIGVLGVLRHRVEYNGADITAVEVEPILISKDPNFRPTDVEIAGDGALYISDWCNPIVGHMQHNIRDPNRDHSHGRVYRVTWQGKSNPDPVRLKGKPIEEVVQAFYNPERGVRYRARLELSGRETAEVVSQLGPWAGSIEPKTPEDEQALLEALWTFEEHRVPNEELLNKVFSAREPRVRAAAIRTLGHWGEKFQEWAPLLLSAARDESPLVRAEAVKATVSFQGFTTAEVFFEVTSQPTDEQLDYVLNYARNALNIQKQVEDAIAHEVALSDAAYAYALQHANPDFLLQLKRTEELYLAILGRVDVSDAALRTSLAGLADLRNVPVMTLILDLFTEQDGRGQKSHMPILTQLLLEQSPTDMKAVRQQLVRLATQSQTSAASKAGYAACILCDGESHQAFELASSSAESLHLFLDAIPLIPDAGIRSGAFDQVRSLIFETPAAASNPDSAAENTGGLNYEMFVHKGPEVSPETLNALKPISAGRVSTLTLDVPNRMQTEGYALRFTGFIDVRLPGKYTFFLKSDDGSRLYLNNALLINNDGLHGAIEQSAQVDLTTGFHPITVNYFNGTGDYTFEVAWQGPSLARQVIPAESFSISNLPSLSNVAIQTLKYLPGHDQRKFEDLVAVIKGGRNQTAAIAALHHVPAEHWQAGQLVPLADNLVAYLTEIPVSERTGKQAMAAMALAKTVADHLPATQKQSLLERLENLDVRVIAIGTVEERMIYDKEKIVVEAGKVVEFVFSNSDNMPHNFSILMPGALEEIGLLSDKTAQDADAMARHYIPVSEKVLLGSRLVRPGETERITFQVPTTPGVYPYVCTYPGHWRRMYGALYVVDANQLRDEDALARLVPQDEQLKLLQRNTEWKYEDLQAAAGHVAMGDAPRSFEVGKQLFKVAACVSCHKLNDEGQAIGPDLAKLDPPRSFQEVLRDVLEPSLKINEKYASQMFAMEDGQILSGLVVSEEGDEIRVVTNPLTPDKPTVIHKANVEERSVSKVSLMPQGVLNKLTEEEIFDLIAYVYAKGDKTHPLFAEHAGHQH